MLFGDNLGDFLSDAAKTQEERNAQITKNLKHWGNDWFMLANPAYGDWQSILDDPKESNLNAY